MKFSCVTLEDMNEPKLICSDVDRTLVTKNLLLPEENKRWVRNVVLEKHIPFCIVSGRFRGSVDPLVRLLDVPVVKCCFNGNYIQDGDDVLYDRPADPEVVRKMLRFTRRKGMVNQIFDLDDWYTECNDGYWYDLQVKMSGKQGVVCDLDRLLDKWEKEGHRFYKLTPRSLDTGLVRIMVDTLRDAVGDVADVFLSSESILETAPKGTDKANAIPVLARRFSVTPDEIMAFGDFDNDLGMLKASGFSVAMGNARPELKSVASYVTDTCENAGVGKVIKKIFFGM